MMNNSCAAEPLLPTAFVMNMFYTGLGIARSLGEHGIPVVGLSARRGVYGNYTRYAKVLSSPDSRDEPKALLAFLVELGRDLEKRGVIFPTRDDDLVFLDRFRAELEPYFSIVAPRSDVLAACLDKGETALAAARADVPAPRSWVVGSSAEVKRVAGEVAFPCVLKPLAAHHWRQGVNWELVGGRKAIGISSERELLAEYELIAHADERALIQEMVQGGDDCLTIVACYVDGASRWVAGFNTQKVLQIPAGFGTGCIVQSVSRPELFERTKKLLKTMNFSGIAEVEYKWDAASSEYKLIEVNPRPWDQHRLGACAGVDLVYLAYGEHAGLEIPVPASPVAGFKWVAEDALVHAALRAVWRGDSPFTLLQLARGKKTYAIWSAQDPVPALVYWINWFPQTLRSSIRSLWSALRHKVIGRATVQEGVRL
jgi:D-aspartate ligase